MARTPDPVHYAVEWQYGSPPTLLKKTCTDAIVLDTALHFAQQVSRKHTGVFALVYEYEARQKTLRAMCANGAILWPKDCGKCGGKGKTYTDASQWEAQTCPECYGLGKVPE